MKNGQIEETKIKIGQIATTARPKIGQISTPQMPKLLSSNI
jgi:hypothetical protein